MEDTIYFAIKTGLEDRMDIVLRENPTFSKGSQFWSRVRMTTLLTLVSIYCDDFLMFGYSPTKYLNNLGVTVDEKSVLKMCPGA